MDFMLNIDINPPEPRISYQHKIFLAGSCFTEHIGGRLNQLKFSILQNPHGILFDPLNVCKSLVSYIEKKEYKPADLFYLNELWQSWEHHSVFSGMEQDQVIETINHSQNVAHHFLRQSEWLILTFGSSFCYQLVQTGEVVANCHRAPAQWFKKRLAGIDEIISSLDNCVHRLFQFNPNLKIIFTVSPVRHIRDGVIENNRSKARLIESAHHLVNKFDRLFYFPAYELVVDVLRDYRFYDIDMVHPNYAATQYVFDQFAKHYIDETSYKLMEEIRSIVSAFKHKPFQPSTKAHQDFLKKYLIKIQQFLQQHSQFDFNEELNYFSGK